MFGITNPLQKGSNLRLYTNAFVVVDGSLLAQETSVSIEKKSNGSPTFTLASGLAGVSLGAGTVEISIENAVPTHDFEFNPDVLMRIGAAVEVGVVMASRQSVFKGFITDATYSHAVNDSAKLSIKLICRYTDFE